MLHENSALMEVLHDVLVTELKEDLIILTVKSDDVEYESHEKAHLAIDNIEKEIEKP